MGLKTPVLQNQIKYLWNISPIVANDILLLSLEVGQSVSFQMLLACSIPYHLLMVVRAVSICRVTVYTSLPCAFTPRAYLYHLNTFKTKQTTALNTKVTAGDSACNIALTYFSLPGKNATKV